LVNEEKSSPKRKKKLRTQINGKFKGSVDGNK
jgi:hypothetical protein